MAINCRLQRQSEKGLQEVEIISNSYSMNNKIWEVLSKLGEQANKERQGESIVHPEDKMLAITTDTGMFFNIILKAMQARRILEIGTSTGYSTLWFADAVKQNNHNKTETEKSIITIDENPSKIQRASENFYEAGVKDIIEIREGQAMHILSEMLKDYQNKSGNKKVGGLFDFVFLDADKENCIDYFELTLPMLRVGGIIAADNMLHPESSMLEMTKYGNYVKSKSNVQSVTVSVGNGEEITIKIS